MKRLLFMCLGALLVLASCSTVTVDNTPVPIEINKFLGTWYEVARFDHSFERGIVKSVAEYSLNEDGRIVVVNSGVIQESGEIKVSKGKAKLTETPGLLKVSFFLFFYSDYRVLMISDDYRYALVGGKDDNYLWILSRNTYIEEEDKQIVMKEARHRGYDMGKLIWVRQ